MCDEDRIWASIVKYLSKNKKLHLLSESSKSLSFKIIKLQMDNIFINFPRSGYLLKLEKQRFISGYKMLKDSEGKWVKIGANRTIPKKETLEWTIKKHFDGKMNGLMTAPWIAAILVGAFKNIVFNNKKKGQALMMEK